MTTCIRPSQQTGKLDVNSVVNSKLVIKKTHQNNKLTGKYQEEVVDRQRKSRSFLHLLNSCVNMDYQNRPDMLVRPSFLLVFQARHLVRKQIQMKNIFR